MRHSQLYLPGEHPSPLQVTVAGTSASVQLCLSPHCTTLVSLIEGAPTSQWSQPSGPGWRDIVARSAGKIDFAPLGPYTCGSPLAPFLTAVLRDPTPLFEDQVREIEGVDESVVLGWLHATFGQDVPAVYRPFRDAPRESLTALSRCLERYHRVVVAPLWPTIRGFLSRELVRVGYLLATQPTSVVLDSLHPSMRVVEDTLVIDTAEGPLSGTLEGRKLKLTPLIATGDAILVDLNGEDEIKVGYAAPGVEELWASQRDHVDPTDSELAGLLGETRAEILQLLEEPDSTTTLAHRLGLAPATVSSHLASLASLGLVERTRVGRRVFYTRTERAVQLLGIFACDLSLAR